MEENDAAIDALVAKNVKEHVSDIVDEARDYGSIYHECIECGTTPYHQMSQREEYRYEDEYLARKNAAIALVADPITLEALNIFEERLDIVMLLCNGPARVAYLIERILVLWRLARFAPEKWSETFHKFVQEYLNKGRAVLGVSFDGSIVDGKSEREMRSFLLQNFWDGTY